MSQKITLVETLETVKDETEGDKITFGEIADILNSRGFGPLLIAPAMITVLPTGAIPTIPSICGLFILLISVQILIGRKHPWLPNKLKEMSFDRGAYKKYEEKIKPWLKWVDTFFKPRLSFLAGNIAKYVIAVLCIFLAICMSIFEIVPFLAALPASAILFLGLGLSTKDGIMISLGGLLVGCSAASIYFFIL